MLNSVRHTILTLENAIDEDCSVHLEELIPYYENTKIDRGIKILMCYWNRP